MAQLLGIALHRYARGPMEMLDHGELTRAQGLVGDFRGQPGPRQVTLLSQAAWQACCDETGVDLPWTTRRANLLVGGLELYQTVGKRIKIGVLELLITRETDPCERMDEAHPGLLEALARDWRGGVCCQVMTEGRIRLGDKVELIDAD